MTAAPASLACSNRRLHDGDMPIAGLPHGAHSAAEGVRRRWGELLDGLTGLLQGAECVLIDGPAVQADLFAARLGEALVAQGRTISLTADRAAAWDVAINLRTGPAGGPAGGGPPARLDGANRDRRLHDGRAEIAVDLHDPDWPVIRRVSAPLAAGGPWYLTETRAFFGCRAATWDAKFGDDLPAYRAAVAESGIRSGGVAIDVGCGTGRALPPLRDAVGPSGTVIALDVTPEMLHAARGPAAIARASLVLADARALPFPAGSVDAIFAAGLVSHLPDTEAGLHELARVTRPGGLLVLFHPSGRAALAARHGRELSPAEPLAERPLRAATATTGWTLKAYDDAKHRFFALAERR
jgi:ubiquinone/menaquinone biosynthesis C-methylase UbiE